MACDNCEKEYGAYIKYGVWKIEDGVWCVLQAKAPHPYTPYPYMAHQVIWWMLRTPLLTSCCSTEGVLYLSIDRSSGRCTEVSVPLIWVMTSPNSSGEAG
ncbi:hypothetical protein EON63_22415, partial [archaeon]